MILFYKKNSDYFVVQAHDSLPKTDLDKLVWLFGQAKCLTVQQVQGWFVGPRKEMITPWSTNAVEITQNMGIPGIVRIEQFVRVAGAETRFDPMLKALYKNLTQDVFTIEKQPAPIVYLEDIAAYNASEGLALSPDEVQYLQELSQKIGRKLTDSEVFGFSQVNSEHCRHKIFNGRFVINGKEMPESLFGWIKKTAQTHPNRIVSAYKDNVAFIKGPRVEQFAPKRQDKADEFEVSPIETVISLKAETHNFPTTVEPFNGAATGSGGEIRDRMAGGKAAIPIAGTAVYMTSYSRLQADRQWEKATQPRPWLYQTPDQILIKASNGASDFGNKFGQPLICGSVLTFEHNEDQKKYGYDKVIMLAGGIGFAKAADSQKDRPEKGDKIIVMGGDNYRIGMGGGAVSSVATGEYNSAIELNAVQRSNPEMQKRVYNAIRALAEMHENPVVSIHDHGAGGHLNCLSELVEETGGTIWLHKLPVGDPTLSAKEIIGNESQERMGLVLKQKHIEQLKAIARRERAPMYVVGETTGDLVFRFEDKNQNRPIDLHLAYLFGKPPKTILEDTEKQTIFQEIDYSQGELEHYANQILQLEAVACKDWLTNKVDRSVTGKIAKQQTTGSVQLPLNDVGVVCIDYRGTHGIATAIGHAPVSALVQPENGSVLSITEALTNLVWAPLDEGLKGVSLSANWMWPARNPGENARLYKAVKAASEFAMALEINIPTGKDSLSMTQKYSGGEKVYSPGTVIISAVGEVTDVKKVVSPALKNTPSKLLYIDFAQGEMALGGSSFAQIRNRIGTQTPAVKQPEYFKNAFEAVQELVKQEKILAGHDISAGGLFTTLTEMCFTDNHLGISAKLDSFDEPDLLRVLFSEKPGVVIQVENQRLSEISSFLAEKGLKAFPVGEVSEKREFTISHKGKQYQFNPDQLRDTWFKTSYLLDQKQSGSQLARKRLENYKKQELNFDFGNNFRGSYTEFGISPDRREKTNIKAAIIREKGVNGDREMAYSMHLAGFDVKDIHTTDLIAGRETLADVNFIVFVGGFSNSDVLGSAKGWAGAFLYNPKAKAALDNFYKRPDTLSLGVCNGCQLMTELGLIYPEHEQQPKMLHNDSGKFESAFLTVDILPSNSVMLGSLAGRRLGIWVAHGEGKFELPLARSEYQIPAKYTYDEYPGNPNGSPFGTAAIVSADGRHLAMMPHLERSIFPWQWAHYPENRSSDQVSPWVEAFANARNWVIQQTR